MTADIAIPDFARHYPNLARADLGCEIAAVSDEFFAPAARLLSPAAPVFVADKYDDCGKWMDGWETRRRRSPAGGDWCVLRLGFGARLRGFEIDTRHFRGNEPAFCAIDGGDGADGKWTELTSPTPLAPDARRFVAAPENAGVFRAVRLRIYPDGGVARLRVFGEAARTFQKDEEADFAAIACGGRVVAASDERFGAAQNLLLPGRAANPGEGWETRRRRSPGADWAIIALAAPAIVNALEVDTSHFKGNYPDSCSFCAAPAKGGEAIGDGALIAQSVCWPAFLPPQKLRPDSLHTFNSNNKGGFLFSGAITHLRFNIHPDGGVARLRVIARAAG